MTNVETLIVIVKDGLMFPSGVVAPASYTCNFFCRVPADWVEGEQIKAEHLEKIYQRVYGETWRDGNSDGSRYIVQDSYSKTFDPETVKNTKWSGTVNDSKNHYWFYLVTETGEVKSVTAEEFQQDIDASFQTPPQSGFENRGMPQSPGGETELNININRVGAVNFETSIRPFYQTIVPLLNNYKGSGEFISLLAFDPSGMSEIVEDVAGNAHGAYLRIRRFFYLNPKNNVTIGVNSIHSNYLRHVQTNDELLVSFELCKNFDNRTAALYYRFEGPKSELFKLTAAIEPLLDGCNFKAVSPQ